MTPWLSILIPITPDRKEGMQELLKRLGGFTLCLHAFADDTSWIKTMNDDKRGVQVIVYQDNKELTLGEKRESLYKLAGGMFSWQIDSDDLVSEDAVDLFLAAIKSNPNIPCITFKENCMMNGEYKSSRHSIEYEKWQDGFDGYDFVRCAFYKNVIRTDIARSVPFPKIRWSEDEQWSMAVKPFLTEEIHIDKEIYFYIYEPKDTHNERYGIV